MCKSTVAYWKPFHVTTAAWQLMSQRALRDKSVQAILGATRSSAQEGHDVWSWGTATGATDGHWGNGKFYGELMVNTTANCVVIREWHNRCQSSKNCPRRHGVDSSNYQQSYAIYAYFWPKTTRQSCALCFWPVFSKQTAGISTGRLFYLT